jgi:hypothetical protein
VLVAGSLIAEGDRVAGGPWHDDALRAGARASVTIEGTVTVATTLLDATPADHR